ncbi:3035_t:CDS:1, partial [Gigaspora margarita]
MNFENGFQLYKNKQYQEAFKTFLATIIDPRSCFYLGYFYEKGIYVKKDLWESIIYYDLYIEDINNIKNIEDSNFKKYKKFLSISFFKYIIVSLKLLYEIEKKYNSLYKIYNNKYGKEFDKFKFIIGYSYLKGKNGTICNSNTSIYFLKNLNLKLSKKEIENSLQENSYDFKEFFSLINLHKKICLKKIKEYILYLYENNFITQLQKEKLEKS